jgi:hypothetical protein
MITITAHTVVHTAVFGRVRGGNVFGVVYREHAAAPWQLDYRFRWDSDDAVSLYTAVAKPVAGVEPADEMAIAHALSDSLCGTLREFGTGDIYRLDFEGDARSGVEACAIIMSQPWARHVQYDYMPPTGAEA